MFKSNLSWYFLLFPLSDIQSFNTPWAKGDGGKVTVPCVILADYRTIGPILYVTEL